MTDQGPDTPWKIERAGRAWQGSEILQKLDRLPDRLEVVQGKLCLSHEQRVELLAALLENLGIDEAIRLGKRQLWRQALDRLPVEDADRTLAQDIQECACAPDLSEPPLLSNTATDPKAPPDRYWNYRVISFTSASGEQWSAIHEVHYEGGRPIGYSAGPAIVLWDEAEEGSGALGILERMRQAVAKPVLQEREFLKPFEDRELSGAGQSQAAGPAPKDVDPGNSAK